MPPSTTTTVKEATDHELRDRNQNTSRLPQSDISDSLSGQSPHDTKMHVFKMIVCGYSFFISGVNDGCLGPLIPYILASFNIGTGKISLITFIGWAVAMPANPLLSKSLPLSLILVLGATLQVIAQIMRPWGPFSLYVISFFVCALGMAIQDSHANTFVSSVNVAHRWLGFIHASYAGGLVVAPMISTTIASKTGLTGGVESWRSSYYVLIVIDTINVAGTALAFRDSFWRREETRNSVGTRGRRKLAMQELKESLKSWPLWAISISFLFQLGAMMTAAGWVVEFLIRIRGGNLSKMGYVPTGCNAGTLIGRLVLAEPIHRIGEQRTILASFVLILAFQLVFWLVPNVIGSALALALMGFFSGPFIPVGISTASKLFPRKIRSAALGFIFVLAQAGGAIFPSLTGLVAQQAGVGILQPIVTALLILGGVFWWLIPKVAEAVEQER